MNKYNATGHAMKVREEVLGYGFVLLGFAILILTINLYYKTYWYWIPTLGLSVLFLIIGFGLLKIEDMGN